MKAVDKPDAPADLQLRLQASLTPGERLRRALEASGFAREFAKAAVRRRNPELGEDEINRVLVRELYGDVRRSRGR